MKNFQITATATGTIPILPVTFWNSPVKPSVPFQWMIVYNRGSNPMNFGGDPATVTVTQGIPVPIQGYLTFGPGIPGSQNLNDWYVYIVSGDKLDVAYQE
jgi:hypothetical protein